MKKTYTREDVIAEVQDKDVEFIRLQFTDMFGQLKNLAITSSQLERALDNRFSFDGYAVNGFENGERSDLYLYPDYSTLEIFPWRPQQGKVARLICDVYTADGKPYEADPRYILKRAIGHAAELGYSFQVGPECEFFLFHTDEEGRPTTVSHEKAGYFDVAPLDLGESARRDMILNLEDMGFEIEASHHEVAPAQHEIDFKYADALNAADNIITFKQTVKKIAYANGLHATFMPKHIYGTAGSGMHINMSLQKDGKNIFQDASDPNGLSKEAYYFIGGIMKHIKGMAAITNPLVNSYKRLVPGFEAPVYIAWSTTNRSPLIRIPATADGEGTRIELRSPDSAANPYLTLAVCLSAGLQGIREKILPPESINANIFALTAKERKELNIDQLPGTLLEAVEELEKDTFIQDVLGDHIAGKYIDAKRKEWHEYRSQVSEWEIQEYLYKY